MLVTGSTTTKELQIDFLIIRDPMYRTRWDRDRITTPNTKSLIAAVHYPLALCQKVNLFRLGMIVGVGGRSGWNGRFGQALVADRRIPMSQDFANDRPILGHERFAVGQGDKRSFHGFCFE